MENWVEGLRGIAGEKTNAFPHRQGEGPGGSQRKLCPLGPCDGEVVATKVLEQTPDYAEREKRESERRDLCAGEPCCSAYG